jgi:Raf kinase inhibitor-like YbhB/YbcL family protein
MMVTVAVGIFRAMLPSPRWVAAVGLTLFLGGVSHTPAVRAQGEPDMTLTLSSKSFDANESIPTRFTCEGTDVSPQLAWSGLPEGTVSLVLIVDDPDAPDPRAPQMTWVHWVLFNIPAGSSELPEGVPSSWLPAGTLEGLNDWRRTGYGGPCPPIGRHRYFFKLYALDTELQDLSRPTKAQLERAMAGYILDSVELVGTYEKQG